MPNKHKVKKNQSVSKRMVFFSLLAVVAAGIYLSIRNPEKGRTGPKQLASQTIELAKDLQVPWQLAWLPPDRILFTEMTGSIKSLNIKSKEVKNVYQIPGLAREIQAGVLGLVLHPAFNTNSQVFVSYNYYLNEEIKLRVDLLTFEDDTLHFAKTIVDSIPSFAISIGGRLMTTEDQKLFLTVGEGAYSENAQDAKSLQGKILRFNLDGTIPKDNPSPNSPVWSAGFRNPQGICEGRSAIYATEHGTFSNDELNQIEKDGNYGWPLQSGQCIDSNCLVEGYRNPLSTWTPTVAPSGIDYYQGKKYPFLRNHVLIACLKGQKIIGVEISEDGTQSIDEKNLLVNKIGRIRDVLVNPEGRIFVATSNEDVYGSKTIQRDKILEVIPIDSLIPINERSITPPPILSLDSTNLSVNIVAKNLRLPWDLNWVKGEKIWFNERGGAIKELDLPSGQIKLIHMVDDVFESTDNSGMHGFAVHPNFPEKPSSIVIIRTNYTNPDWRDLK